MTAGGPPGRMAEIWRSGLSRKSDRSPDLFPSFDPVVLPKIREDAVPINFEQSLLLRTQVADHQRCRPRIEVLLYLRDALIGRPDYRDVLYELARDLGSERVHLFRHILVPHVHPLNRIIFWDVQASPPLQDFAFPDEHAPGSALHALVGPLDVV